MLDLAAPRTLHHDHAINHSPVITGDRKSIAEPGRPTKDSQASSDMRCDLADSPAWLLKTAGFHELGITFEPRRKALWQYMTPRRRPSFTGELLTEMAAVLDLVEDTVSQHQGGGMWPIRYLILASKIPRIFNLGGDLPLFLQLIRDQDRHNLSRYAHSCIDVQHRRAINLASKVHTICLVQGDALGGGFEAALAHDIIVAERSAKFGLPEILFNLFPGMGAHSFLSRRLTPVHAERIMLSGRVYTAEELYEIGIVDVLADDGDGIGAVAEYIDRHERASIGREAVFNLRRMVNPVTREELIRITEYWVDRALSLSPRDLRRMEHLATAQDRRWSRLIEPTLAAE